MTGAKHVSSGPVDVDSSFFDVAAKKERGEWQENKRTFSCDHGRLYMPFLNRYTLCRKHRRHARRHVAFLCADLAADDTTARGIRFDRWSRSRPRLFLHADTKDHEESRGLIIRDRRGATSARANVTRRDALLAVDLQLFDFFPCFLCAQKIRLRISVVHLLEWKCIARSLCLFRGKFLTACI